MDLTVTENFKTSIKIIIIIYFCLIITFPLHRSRGWTQKEKFYWLNKTAEINKKAMP